MAATRAIRALAGPGADIPIIALTASFSTELCRDYRNAGMDAIVEKPINLKKLLDAMAQVVNQHGHAQPGRRDRGREALCG